MLINKEIKPRITVKLNKSINSDNSNGVMTFGADNDYPQVIESLILGSQTGKNAFRTFSKFVAGSGFVNPEIGRQIVGRDHLGKPITLDKIRIEAAKSIAKFNGVYIHANVNLNKEVGDTKVLNFPNYRLSKEDDSGFCAKVGYSPNWANDRNKTPFKKSEIAWFNQFNLDPKVILSQLESKDITIEQYKGQVYTGFIDNSYLYPLSPFDSVYLDLDTEYQIQIFKNNEIRQGFTDKVVLHVAPTASESEKEELINKVRSWMGADGDKFLMFEGTHNDDGELIDDGFKIEIVPKNINDQLFKDWEVSLANSIRKAVELPAILIDYEASAMGGESGAAMKTAAEIYNALTKDTRDELSNILKDIYSNHENPVLKKADFTIKPLSLFVESENEVQEEDTTTEAQANLRGSVGGVQGILQIQQSVSQQLTDYSSGIEILKEIFGFNEDESKRILGTPKIEK